MKSKITVDEYISNSGNWNEALILLRDVILSAGLNETIKWGAPVYTFKTKNIAGMAAFKSYVGIWFYQGALLQDKSKRLINAQEGITRALRQWRFDSAEEIRRDIKTIKDYLNEAILNQKHGKEIKPAKDKPLIIPEELQELFKSNPELLFR